MNVSVNKGCFIVAGLMGLSIETLRKQDWTEFSWHNNVYNAKFSLKTRLELGYPMEYTYFHWLWLFAHYYHYYS